MAEKTPTESIRELRDIQGSKGTWNHDPYMLGMFNGLELALSILEGGREPEFRERPADGYLCDKPQPDLSGPEFEPVASGT